MREIVNLFSERESRDELGVGQVRDALSDTLFPGTSTLLTRARYMILIPWCFMAAGRSGGTTEAIARRVDDFERSLIPALKADGDEEGLLGRVAGRGLKDLPSSLYWVALRQFGILSSPSLAIQDAIELGSPTLSDDDEGDGASLTSRRQLCTRGMCVLMCALRATYRGKTLIKSVKTENERQLEVLS